MSAVLECAICYEVGEELVAWPAGCGHRFCADCTGLWCAKTEACPMCRLTCNTASSDASQSKGPDHDAARAQLIQELAARRQAREAERNARAQPRTRCGKLARRVVQSVGNMKDRMQEQSDWMLYVLEASALYLEEDAAARQRGETTDPAA